MDTKFTLPAKIRETPRPDGSEQVFEFSLDGFSDVMLNDLVIDAVVALAKRQRTTPQEILRRALFTAPVELS